MGAFVRRLGPVFRRLQIVHYRRKLFIREQADRRDREHHERVANGIKDNMGGC
jgi:hypothetical protein